MTSGRDVVHARGGALTYARLRHPISVGVALPLPQRQVGQQGPGRGYDDEGELVAPRWRGPTLAQLLECGVSSADQQLLEALSGLQNQQGNIAKQEQCNDREERGPPLVLSVVATAGVGAVHVHVFLSRTLAGLLADADTVAAFSRLLVPAPAGQKMLESMRAEKVFSRLQQPARNQAVKF